MTKVYSIIYYILIFICTFVVSFIWVSYFTKKPVALLSISAIIGLIFCLIVYTKNRKNNKQKLVEKTDEKNLDIIKKYLLLSDQNSVNKFLNKYIDNTKILPNRKYIVSQDNNTIYYPITHVEQADIYTLSACIKDIKSKYEKIVFIVFLYDNSVYKTIDNTFLSQNIVIMTINNLYKDYIKNKNDNLQEYNLSIEQPKKITWSKVKETIFNSNNWKKYLYFGLIILLFSLTTRYKIYYITVASILWMLGVVCLAKKLARK